MSNPYQCFACGGEMEHATDCPWSPAAIAKRAEEEETGNCRGE